MANSTTPVIIRVAGLRDAKQIGLLAAKTYHDQPLSDFMAPHRRIHPNAWKRGYIQRATNRMLNPRNVSYVAVAQSGKDKGKVIGLTQSIRLGDDKGAKETIRAKGLLMRLFLWVMGFVYGLWCKVLGWVVGGDRSADPVAMERFGKYGVYQDETYWKNEKSPERRNRWHAQSVVVAAEHQGKGIGKKLIGEVIKRAEKENVPIGLESSPEGEMMYRSVGFELLGRFEDDFQLADHDGRGGVMLYTPKAWKKDDSVKI